MATEQESFWNAKSFVVVTDKTKPAMKATIKKLNELNKKVHVVDMSDKPEEGALKNMSELPDGVAAAVIGITKSEPANVIKLAEEKGIKNFWIHQRTDTPDVEKRRSESQAHYIMGRCPMMYLEQNISIHRIHGSINKLRGKF